MSALDSPIAGRFFQDIGRYGFSGSATPARSGRRVEIWYVASNGDWRRILATNTRSNGTWSISKPVTVPGLRRFRATRGGSPAASSTVHSGEVRVTVEDSTVNLHDPDPNSFDSLRNPIIRGSVFPARSGVLIHFQVRSGREFHDKAVVRTDRNGRFAIRFSTGTGRLHRYELRARDWIDRSDRWETSGSRFVRRKAVLNPQWRPTTAADVADTYRSGCPVGPSRLTTISMNFYGFDERMHRGVMIIRDDLTKKVIRSFRQALEVKYPIRRMDNPNVWDGNDPEMMADDNTSGFNCRKVVGNPYAQSPHSYGIALDANTVRNPYRDATGRWWPESGRKYIDRTPWKPGMLTKSSALTRALRSRDFLWGGLWSPGKDYQHFEYDR